MSTIFQKAADYLKGGLSVTVDTQMKSPGQSNAQAGSPAAPQSAADFVTAHKTTLIAGAAVLLVVVGFLVAGRKG